MFYGVLACFGGEKKAATKYTKIAILDILEVHGAIKRIGEVLGFIWDAARMPPPRKFVGGKQSGVALAD